MRVGMIAPPWFPVPPERYGGTEQVVSLLTEGLLAEGIDVTLFASGDSATSATLEFVHDRAPSHRIGEMALELEHVLACMSRAEEFDLVHDHSGLLAVCLAASVETPLLHTAHGPLTGRSGELYRRAVHYNPRARLVSLTDAQRRPAPELPWVATCPNAVDVSGYDFHAEHDGYLAFLGRMCHEKGVREAIEVARAAGLELRIAAKCREPAERRYFDEHVRPRLGPTIHYLGEVEHEEKVELVGRALALVAPINWEEPFGLALIEAAACGTPVVATGRGSVPEVVEEGVTGLVVSGPDEMPAALARVGELDRRTIRARAEERFTPARMIEAYVEAYTLALDSLDAAAPL